MTAPKRTKPNRSKGTTPPKPPGGGGGDDERQLGPDARIKAMALLAEGYQVGAVARMLGGIRRQTVADWRDSPEGQRLLDEARRARDAELAGARAAATRILRDAGPRAAQRLVDRLSSTVPFEATTAAEAILARIGIPRASKVEATVDRPLDLTQLTDDELALLAALHEKASG